MEEKNRKKKEMKKEKRKRNWTWRSSVVSRASSRYQKRERRRIFLVGNCGKGRKWNVLFYSEWTKRWNVNCMANLTGYLDLGTLIIFIQSVPLLRCERVVKLDKYILNLKWRQWWIRWNYEELKKGTFKDIINLLCHVRWFILFHCKFFKYLHFIMRNIFVLIIN